MRGQLNPEMDVMNVTQPERVLHWGPTIVTEIVIRQEKNIAWCRCVCVEKWREGVC